ncbi:MAG: anthrax toxin-like adenylyl cyclase domain-containing protein, partial [Vibrionaceae bacterium]
SEANTAKPQSTILQNLQKYQAAFTKSKNSEQQGENVEKSSAKAKNSLTQKVSGRLEDVAQSNGAAAKSRKVDVMPMVIEAANENVEEQGALNSGMQPARMRSRRLSSISSQSIAAEKAELEKVGKPFIAETLLYSEALQQTADKYHVVIGLRTPNKFGEVHLREGFPTKNFHVKAKSSQVGPTAGFITEKAIFSKVGPNRAAEHQREIYKAVQKGAKLIDLRLSSQQIRNALDNGLMLRLGDGKYSATYHGQEFNFSIQPPDNIVIDLHDGLPVKVLTNPPEVDENGKPIVSDAPDGGLKPITADYDLFALIPRKNQSVNDRNVSVRPRLVVQPKTVEDGKVEPLDITKKPDSAFAQALLKFTTPDLSKLDLNKGNFHNFGSAIINDINLNAQEEGYTGGKLVWHGDEIGNPFSNGFDSNDSPIFFIPHQEPIQITSEAELQNFYQKLQELGYEPERSPRFNV